MNERSELRITYLTINLLLGLVSLLISCRNESAMELTTINGYPEDFRGCGCAFAKTETDYKNQKFIYLEKYGATDNNLNYKYIEINEELIKWSNNTPKNFDINILFDKIELAEGQIQKKSGTIKLIFNDNFTISSYFVGYCGC